MSPVPGAAPPLPTARAVPTPRPQGRAGPWRGLGAWAGRWSPPSWSGSWRGGGRPCRYGWEGAAGLGDAGGRRTAGRRGYVGVGVEGVWVWGREHRRDAEGVESGTRGDGGGQIPQTALCGVQGDQQHANGGVRGVRPPLPLQEPILPTPTLGLEVTALCPARLHPSVELLHPGPGATAHGWLGGPPPHVLPFFGAFGRRWGDLQ